ECAKLYDRFSNTLFYENLFWYCRFRWVVIAILLVFGVLSTIPGIFEKLYLHTNLIWPFIIAGFLTFFNFLFLAHAKRLKESYSGRSVRFNMWSQILFDLVFLTMVVHFVGSLDTFVSFAYLYHVVLACIFFTRIQSFMVILAASILLLICIAFEISGLIPPASIYVFAISPHIAARDPLNVIIPVFSILAIWLVVWYLVSHLSELVRKRDYELIETNRFLQKKQDEEKKHIIWLTHELKAPLAAIDANILLMREGQCGVLPEKAVGVIERIAARSRKLSHEIQEMLQLANIRTMRKEALRSDSLDLSGIIAECLSQLNPSAEEQNISFEKDLQSARIIADEDHVKMLLLNVISNAVIYSHKNGVVRIECRPVPEQGPTVVVEDHGIGIAPNKLSKIFDEYYHTTEAIEHNRNSTGLGLAIVKHIAHRYNLSVRVASKQNWGTRFVIRFPNSVPS
ncbi:MAG: sensor histidine kinase, partial [Candidatus Latescibacterota bacterium]